MVEPAAIAIFTFVTAVVLVRAQSSERVSVLAQAMREGRFFDSLNQDEARAAFRRSLYPSRPARPTRPTRPPSGVYFIDEYRPEYSGAQYRRPNQQPVRRRRAS